MLLKFVLNGKPFQKGDRIRSHGIVVSHNERVRKFFKKRMADQKMLHGPIKMRVRFYFEMGENRRCKSDCHRKACKRQHEGQHVFGRPDLSNLIKAIEDPMSKIVFEDDSRICQIEAAKYWATLPRTEIELWDEFPPHDQEMGGRNG